jgi:hypothetical protein
MNENINRNITRIDDLPDVRNQPPINSDMGLPNSYIPMNIHPNPYGNNMNQGQGGPPPPINDFREQSQEKKPYDHMYDMIENTPYNRLPSRDIPMNTIDYSNDERVQNNYIPQETKKDYIREHDDNIEKHRKEKHKTRLIDTVFTEIQIPLIISILFFIFQMPVFNHFFIKFLPFLHLYNQDGNINVYGMIFKSVLFGLFYYFTIETSKYIGEL